ncbi:uncharacterized protein LOC132612276 [Lycium barbarum]|uniref:uncharacterized protein LOC132612276 n=1 Tax=Lycium barbarum TaxID=112863 RepID=UPI00293EA29C|nr:uncharacterized protein LOC132612276 [Lycium barbarum]
MLLAEQPTMEEVQKTVFELNGDSTCGPDGFSAIFYQKCWEVIKANVFNVVKSFFDGQTLPKSITHTNLVLLPKKNVVESFSDMRPISLSNFINKVISRVVHNRLDKLLTRVMMEIGFSGAFIDLIWILLANNWYSVLLNGQAHGFFHSTSGVNLILLVMGCQNGVLSLYHLAYANDTIIFSAADYYSLYMIVDTLQEYEKISGRLINKRKSSFYMFSKVSNELSQQVAAVTGFVRGKFPFTYLGVPITHARKRKVDYTELLKKVKDKLQTWKGKLLSYGGKAVLITSVLQSIPIHVLSSIRPPKCVIKELHKIFARRIGIQVIYDMSKPYVLIFGGSLEPLVHFGLILMWNKYCKKKIPQLGALSYVVPQSWHINDHAEDVSKLISNGRWDINKLMQLFPEDLVQHITQEIDIKYASNEWDRS